VNVLGNIAYIVSLLLKNVNRPKTVTNEVRTLVGWEHEPRTHHWTSGVFVLDKQGQINLKWLHTGPE
jgi:hypothetical protein